MITWILIALLIIAALFVIKISHLRHRLFVFLIIIVVIFLYVSIAIVASKNNLNFSTYEGVVSSGKIYLGWLGNVFGNFKGLTGSAVKMDWTSTESNITNPIEDKATNNDKPSKITGRASVRFSN